MTDKEKIEIIESEKKALAILNEVKSKIRQIRNSTGFSQETVARLVGMSHSGFSKIESGENDITISRLAQLAEVLKTDIANFFPTKDTPKSHNTSATTINTVVNDVNHCVVQQQSDREIEIMKELMEKMSTRICLLEEYLKVLVTEK
jgi:transcriptional regulator with XRE-family HTH domain